VPQIQLADIVMIVFIKAVNRQTAVNTMQNILTC